MSSFLAIVNCWLIGLAAPGEADIQAWCCKHPVPRQGLGLPATSKLSQLVQGSLSVSARSCMFAYVISNGNCVVLSFSFLHSSCRSSWVLAPRV